ncbi:2'-5'-oligoadenylate synthase 1 [Folsomia candida]|nr:2'-5'-oligoadenylate synthase 1 [Folsomia candida]
MPQTLLHLKNDQLRALADNQRPSRAYLAPGRAVINDIFESIRQSDEISLDRARKAGSIGKGTALGDEFCPDFDLVCFINGHMPPFSPALIQAFLRAVKKADRTTQWQIQSITYNQHSVQVEVVTGEGVTFKLDILPAANLVQGDHLLNAMERLSIQEKCVGKTMRDRCKRFRERQNFSTSLAEATVSFVRAVPLNVSRIIRIAQYWDKCVDLGGARLTGRSYLIELVAMGTNLGRKPNRGLQARFSHFLHQMRTLSSACIVFTENYEESQIPADVRRQRPLILDPINPFNNLGFQLRKPEMAGVLQRWREAAEETLDFIGSKNDDVEAWFIF